METNEFSPSASDPASGPVSGRPQGGSGRPWSAILIILAALASGLVGGILSPMLLPYLSEHVPVLSRIPSGNQSAATASRTVVLEDDAVTGLVNQNAAGVVSIVVSKDVSKLRAMQNPFGFPFFFSPFGSSGQGGGDDPGQPQKQQVGSGSGFFVSSDGLIVTNKHVVSDESADYTVTVSGGTEYPAQVLARDPNNDIAVLKIEGNDFPVLNLGDSSQVKVGQTAIAIGNPLGEFANSVSRGIVSGIERNVSAGSGFGQEERLSGIIQTDAAINPGNSGGPLFNLSGEVIGVNVAMAQGAENIGFALPINQVKRIVDQVRETGKISTPYLGVRYIILDDQIQKQSQLPFNYGALVLRGQTATDFAVVPGSPADKAGIVENDIILEVDGQKIDSGHPLANALSERSVGDEVALKVWHKGNTKDIKAVLEERSQ